MRTSAAVEASAARVADLELRVLALDEVLKSRNAYERSALRAARISLSVAALSRAVETRFSATQAAAALRVAAGDEAAVVDRALAFLPTEVFSRDGVPTFHELRARFSAVSTAGRRSHAADTGVLGKALSIAGATLVLPAQAAASRVERSLSEGFEKVREGAGTLSGSTPTALQPYRDYVLNSWASATEKAAEIGGQVWSSVESFSTSLWSTPAAGGADAATIPPVLAGVNEQARKTLAVGREVFESSSVEVRRTAAIFDAADAALESGNLERALETLAALKGSPAEECVAAWTDDATKRLRAERALRTLRAHVNLVLTAQYK